MDRAGNVFVTGVTGAGFPGTELDRGGTAFLAELDASGQHLAYGATFGGVATGNAVALDRQGNVLVAGIVDHSYTEPPNYNWDPWSEPGAGGFLLKLDRQRQVIYNDDSLYGAAYGLAVDAAGDASIAGYTRSHRLPVVGAVQRRSDAGMCPEDDTMVPCTTAFVQEVGPAGPATMFLTYLGGVGHWADDQGAIGIAVHGHRLYVVGFTAAGNFPITREARQSKLAGQRDGFLVIIGPRQAATARAKP